MSTNAINTGKVAVGATAVLIVAARPGREKVRITGGSIFVGADDTVTINTGYPTNDGFTGTSAIELDTDAAIYGIAPSAEVSVNFIELFNT